MVSEQMDMLDEDDARPTDTSTIDNYGPIGRTVLLAQEVAENGEAILRLRNGDVIECHGADSHFYPYEGVIFTEAEGPDGEDAETWVFGENISTIQRH